MRTSTLSTLVLSASLASGVAASQRFAHVLPRELMPRQSQSFQPGTTSGQGSTCQEAFGGQSKLCADSDVCYDESIGDSCCSEGYPCPAGSFCLVKGYCCPDGIDPKTCAINNNVELPADFNIASATKQAPPAATETTASVEVSSGPATVTSTATVAPPFPIPSASGAPAASGTAPAPAGTGLSGTGKPGSGKPGSGKPGSGGSSPQPSATLSPFTGAASSLNIAGGLFGALLGLAGLMAVL